MATRCREHRIGILRNNGVAAAQPSQHGQNQTFFWADPRETIIVRLLPLGHSSMGVGTIFAEIGGRYSGGFQFKSVQGES